MSRAFQAETKQLCQIIFVLCFWDSTIWQFYHLNFQKSFGVSFHTYLEILRDGGPFVVAEEKRLLKFKVFQILQDVRSSSSFSSSALSLSAAEGVTLYYFYCDNQPADPFMLSLDCVEWFFVLCFWASKILKKVLGYHFIPTLKSFLMVDLLLLRKKNSC